MSQTVVALAATLLLSAGSCSSSDPASDASAHWDAILSDTTGGNDADVPDLPTKADSSAAKIVEKVRVELAASLPVSIDLLTHDKRQFVAYYNGDRFLTIAGRTLSSKTWTSHVTSSVVPWNVHNSVVMALDSDNQLHVAGNMHAVPLNYYRTSKPLDPASLAKIPQMVGTQEAKVTYPRFLKGPQGELIFGYRDGYSGDGVHIYNRYNPTTQKWTRLMAKPLFAAVGMSAYPHGPVQLGGVYHVAWVWRDTPDSATNHHPSYARSVDLIHWTKADGTPLTLPLTLQNSDVVESVPANSGLENYNIKVGVDAFNRPIVSYIKWDKNGDTQLYNARFQNKQWKVHQSSSWKGHYIPGSGASGPKLFIQPVAVEADGGLSQAFVHWTESPSRSTNWSLDSATLKPNGSYPYVKNAIRDLVYGTVKSTHPGMRPASIIGRGDKPEHRRYFLHWEVVDKKGSTWPPPTDLHLYKLDGV